MSILNPKTRGDSARVAGGITFSVFSLFMPSYLQTIDIKVSSLNLWDFCKHLTMVRASA